MKVDVEFEQVKNPIKSVKLELNPYEAKILLILLGNVGLKNLKSYSGNPYSMYELLRQYMNVDNEWVISCSNLVSLNIHENFYKEV